MSQTWWALDAKQPSTLNEIWQRCCPEIYTMWTDEHKNLLTKACVGFLVKSYSFLDMTRLLMKTVPGVRSDWRKLRWALIDDYRANLGIKLMLLRCVARRAQNMPVKLEQEICDNGLYANDKALYYCLNDMQLSQPILNTLYNLPNSSIPSLKIVQKECQQCIVNTLQWINRFVAKKHKFVYEGNNMQHSDIVNELQFEIIRKFYMTTPFLSPEHRESTVKRAAHNYGINLIKYYTHPDRARTRRVAPGTYVNVVQGFAVSGYEGESASHQLDEGFSFIHYGQDNDFFRERAVIDNLMELKDYSKCHEQDLPILELLTLRDNNAFIKWAESAYRNYFDSAEEVYEYLGEEVYYDAIAKYLQLPLERVLNAVYVLRNRLSLV